MQGLYTASGLDDDLDGPIQSAVLAVGGLAAFAIGQAAWNEVPAYVEPTMFMAVNLLPNLALGPPTPEDERQGQPPGGGGGGGHMSNGYAGTSRR